MRNAMTSDPGTLQYGAEVDCDASAPFYIEVDRSLVRSMQGRTATTLSLHAVGECLTTTVIEEKTGQLDLFEDNEQYKESTLRETLADFAERGIESFTIVIVDDEG